MITIVLILHVFGAAVVLGAGFFSLLSSWRQPFDAARLNVFRFVGRFGLMASIWQFLTGLILYWPEHQEFNHRPLFWIKIGLYLAEGAMVSMLIDRRVKQAEAKAQGQVLPPVTGLSTAVLVWTVILFTIAALGVVLVQS